MWLIILLIVLLCTIYYYLIKPLKYWQEKNVQCEKPLPIIGNMLPLMLKTCSNTDLFHQIYNNHPNGRYVGMYLFTMHSLMITDPELIKKIMVKEFETFPEHRPFISTDIDPLWSKNLFAMEGGEKWHELRATLSPSFTSSKMKAMFSLIRDCAKEFTNYYKSKSEIMEIELKDAFSRFSNDVIATCAFGVTCNSQSDPKNEFYLLAKGLATFDGLRRFMLLINSFSPSLAKFLGIPFIGPKATKFFTTLVSDTLRTREEKNILRPDMLHLLMEARKGRLKYDEDTQSTPEAGFAVVEESHFGKVQKKSKIELTDEDITAQVFIFFFAGFETVSTLMSYTAYELGLNPDIQEKLFREIDEAVKSTNGEFTYENLMSMKYLDMIVSETLRKWPPFPVFDRRSVRPYVIKAEKPGESDVYLEKHTQIVCPTYSLHRDPKYYPDPDKFNPERFNEQNKNSIHPYAYIPFGAGPRNCIGSRFALLEAKLIIAEIVKNFEIVPTAKTQIPIVFSKTNLNPLPDNGFWLALKQRKFN